MENPETPKRRGWSSWSVVRKAQVIAGTTGALVTIVMNIPLNLDLDKYSATSDFLFSLYLILGLPTDVIWKLLGISESNGGFLFVEIVVNTLLCAFIGTLIGWMVSLIKSAKRQI